MAKFFCISNVWCRIKHVWVSANNTRNVRKLQNIIWRILWAAQKYRDSCWYWIFERIWKIAIVALCNSGTGYSWWPDWPSWAWHGAGTSLPPIHCCILSSIQKTEMNWKNCEWWHILSFKDFFVSKYFLHSFFFCTRLPTHPWEAF